MTEMTIVVATESGNCRSFRHMDDAHVFVDQLIAEGEQVLLTLADPLSERYWLYAMIPIDHRGRDPGLGQGLPG